MSQVAEAGEKCPELTKAYRLSMNELLVCIVSTCHRIVVINVLTFLSTVYYSYVAYLSI